jgi:hypothetical protein
MSFAHAPGRRNPPPARRVDHVLVAGPVCGTGPNHSQVIYTDADGSRSFGSLATPSTPGFRGFLDFLDEYLDSRDAANELPDGSLPGVEAPKVVVT